MDRGNSITVGIVGCGLIGASIGAAIAHAFPKARFVLFDVNAENASHVADLLPVAETGSIEAIAGCDFVFVCTPVSFIAGYVSQVAAHADTARTTIVDAGSVKAAIIDALAPAVPANFVPGHPLAGGYASGPGAGSRDVIEGKHFMLTPAETTSAEHVMRATRLLEAAGATVVRLDARMHDHLLAVTSHVPHIISYALVDLLIAAENGAGEPVSDDLLVRSFRTLSTFAQSDVRMWSDIMMHNKDEIRGAIRRLMSILGEYDAFIERADVESLNARLQAAAERRKKLKGESNE
ncbi:MAG: prephenate dehydrogenase [Rhizobiaceae bacterium]|nr:prephenate dehydrogenase [Rhizobiaceae bacterium]